MSWNRKKTKWYSMAMGEEVEVGYLRANEGGGDSDKAWITFNFNTRANMIDYIDGIEDDLSDITLWDKRTCENHNKLTIRIAGEVEIDAIYESLKFIVDEMEKDLSDKGGKNAK